MVNVSTDKNWKPVIGTGTCYYCNTVVECDKSECKQINDGCLGNHWETLLPCPICKMGGGIWIKFPNIPFSL